MTQHTFSSIQKGFTLIELLVVIAIIGILATLIGGNFIISINRSRNARSIADLKKIQQGLEQYYSDYQQYASSLDKTCSTARTNRDYFPEGDPIEDGYSFDCVSQAYCVCTSLIEIGGEFPGANAVGTDVEDGACNWDTGDITQYCVTNIQ